MKKLFILIPVLTAVLVSLGYSKEETLQTDISAVSVFTDRARVTRTGAVSLQAGEHTLLIKNLPDQIDRSSLQVTGKGPAVLKDILFLTSQLEEINDPRIKELTDRLEVLNDSIRVLQDYTAHSAAEKTFLDNIISKLTAVPEKNQEQAELDPDKWIKMVKFYRSKLTELSLETRKYAGDIQSVMKTMDKINRELGDLNGRQSRSRNTASVSVVMTKSGKLNLDMNYIVYGVSWQPMYDIRVSTDSKKLDLTYNAVIRQNTSEDWNGIALSLSTARPAVSGDQPELEPWRIDFYRPEPPVMLRKSRSAAPMAQMMNTMPKEMEMLQEGSGYADAAAEPDMIIESAQVSSGATAVVYTVPGKNTVISDNQEHKVAITRLEFPASFRYSAIPKLTPNAYLKAKVTNSSEYSLLAGKTNIFLDDNFVSNSRLDLVAPSEEFWTFLGIDEGIKVERKLIRKYDSQKGLISKKNKVVYEFQTEITSNKKHEEELVLWDQIPISGNKDIEVELTNPAISDSRPEIKINEHKYVEWLFKLAPGKKVEVPFVFSVQYPRGSQVSGL